MSFLVLSRYAMCNFKYCIYMVIDEKRGVLIDIYFYKYLGRLPTSLVVRMTPHSGVD
jgi:hypothetical protein